MELGVSDVLYIAEYIRVNDQVCVTTVCLSTGCEDGEVGQSEANQALRGRNVVNQHCHALRFNCEARESRAAIEGQIESLPSKEDIFLD